MDFQTELLPSDPLTDDEWNELDGLLLSLDSDDALTLPLLEGYIAGVLCCPVKLKPSAWFPLIWGDAHAYNTMSDSGVGRVIALVLQHYKHVEACLKNPDLAYLPDYEVDTDDTPLWEFWAEGFDLAMQVGSRGWGKFSEKSLNSNMAGETLITLMGIIDLAMDGELVPRKDREELRSMAADLIPAITKSVYELNTRGKISLAKDFMIDVHGEIPKAGRNEQCPCGSGKKYKKCHGA